MITPPITDSFAAKNLKRTESVNSKKGNETVSGMNEPKKIVFPITNVFLVKKSKKFKINVTFFRKLLSILYNHRLRNNILRR